MPLRPAIVAVCLLFSGCGPGSSSVCNTQVDPAVVVRLTDAVTGAPVAEADVLLVDNLAESEVMNEGPPGTYSGGYERSGVFSVQASAMGYTSGSQSDIAVRELPCGPETQTVQLDLAATPATLLILREEEKDRWRVRAVHRAQPRQIR